MLGEKIKQLRKQKRISQEEIAAQVNVVRQTVSKWEKGISIPNVEELLRISKIFEVPVNELLSEINIFKQEEYMSIYIVCGRCGCEMFTPEVFYNYQNAKEYIDNCIADCVKDDFSTELEDENIEEVKDILEWAKENEYVSDNTYMYAEDWTEYIITEVRLSNLKI